MLREERDILLSNTLYLLNLHHALLVWREDTIHETQSRSRAFAQLLQETASERTSSSSSSQPVGQDVSSAKLIATSNQEDADAPTRETLARETLTRESLTRESLERESLPKEKATREVATKETLPREVDFFAESETRRSHSAERSVGGVSQTATCRVELPDRQISPEGVSDQG
eukprot:Gregarina_sp_Pseudo_9__1646@NODE_2107_length_1148_cov_5_224527_g1945_i0_p2_GENE_NODE_2107_length_1148_cov_5_224527_g1945_i0NODE_2107_length_1148_cov_5_224527_g1945_i0_p2_ORF_typecomplete_len173_score21_85_NODE_2107_length_1148_cov_5_224527_g1945_i039557